MALKEDIIRQGGWLFKWRSYLPLLVVPMLLIALRRGEYLERVFGEEMDTAWELFSLAVSLSGLAVRCLVAGYAPKGTSGRNTQRQVADTLNTTGMYSLVRNPLYLGNFLIFAGMTIFVQVWWFAIITWMAFWMYYERIIFTEEEFLRGKFGDEYLSWADKTPMFFPSLKGWVKPPVRFSFRTMVRREFSALFLVFATFAILDVLADLLSEGKLEFSALWMGLFAFNAVLFLALVLIKRKTNLLRLEGR